MALGNRLGTAGLGALSGASVGSTLGPWGTLAGGALGGLSGFLGSADSPKPPQTIPSVGGGQYQQVSQYSPQIQNALNQNILQGLGKNFDFAPIAQQAREQFQTRTLPSIAERFTSMGGGAQRSSAFPAALGQSGADLEGQLAALQAQYGLQQQDLLARLLGQSAYQTGHFPQEPSPLMQLLAPLLMGGINQGGGLSAILSQFRRPEQQGSSPSNIFNLNSAPRYPDKVLPGQFSPFPRTELTASANPQQNYNLPALNRLFQRVV